MEHTGDLESVSRSEQTSLFQNIVTVTTSGSLTKLTLLSLFIFLNFVLIVQIVYGFGNLHDNI